MKRYRLLAIAAAVGAATSLAHAETTLEERLAAAEQRLAALESQDSMPGKVEIKGFMTFAMERASAEDASGNDVNYQSSIPNQDWNLEHLTRAGVQLNATISDRAHAVVQILGRADEDFNAEVQWAYVAYDFTPTLTGRAGRLVLPFYLHSQYSNVGYAYHWIELPSEVYSLIPLDTMEGIDLTWSVNTGPVAHSLNVFWGGMDVEDPSGIVYQVRDQHGANLRSTFGNVTSWLSYSESDTTLDLGGETFGGAIPAGTLTPLNMDGHYASFASVGLQYDNGSLIASGERTSLRLSTPYDWFPDLESSYISVGYRVGKWTPHVTWSEIEHSSISEVDPSGIALGPTDASYILWSQNATQQKGWTFGTRYDLTPGIALKAEVSSYYGFDSENTGNNGLFTGRPDGDAYVYRLAVDTVF